MLEEFNQGDNSVNDEINNAEKTDPAEELILSKNVENSDNYIDMQQDMLINDEDIVANNGEELSNEDSNIEENTDVVEENPTKDEYESIFLVKQKEETEEQDEISFRKKISKWALNHLDYLISSAIILFLMFTTLVIIGDMPFGKRTLLISDTYEQVAVFFNHIYDVFEGKATLFYSNYFAKGMEMFSTLQYMYMNPFYLLALLGGRQNIFLMMTFSIILMMLFNGIIFIWFSRKYFKKINTFLRVVLCLLFVFSSYLNYNFSFTTWLIYPAISLILIDRFINFIKTDKMTSLIFTLTWYIITCYSVGISTIFIAIILSIAFVLYFESKENRPAKLTKLFLVFAIAGFSSLCILLPSVIGVLNTERTGSILKELVGNDEGNFLVKIGAMLFDGIILILSVYYFIKCNKKEKNNKFLLFTAIILFSPVIFDSILKILCFSTYQGFYSRFYFLNEVFLFSVTMMLFDNDLIKFKKTENRFLLDILFILFIFFIVIIYLVFQFTNNYGIGDGIKNPLNTETEFTLVYFVILVVILTFFLLTLLLNSKKIMSSKMAKYVLSTLLIIGISFNYLTFLEHAGDPRDMAIEEFVKSANVSGNITFLNNGYDYNIYNVRIGEKRFTTVFSSLTSKEIIESYKELDYKNGKTFVDTIDGSLIADAILGVNYYITNMKLNRPYLELVKTNKKYYLYKNLLSTNGTFMINKEFSFDNSLTFYDNMQRLVEYYGISGELFSEVELSKTVITTKSSSGKAKLKLEFASGSTGILYSITNFSNISNNSNEGEKVYNISSGSYCRELSFFDNGGYYSQDYEIDNYSIDKPLGKFVLYFLNYDVAEQLCQKLKEKQGSFKYTSNGYEVNFETSEDDNLYVMVPNINGLNYKLNGENVDVNNILGYMITVSPSENQGTFVANYEYPYLIIWLVFVIMTIIIVVGLLLLYRATKFKHIEKIISKFMIAVAGMMVLFIYIFGTLISIAWFFV